MEPGGPQNTAGDIRVGATVKDHTAVRRTTTANTKGKLRVIVDKCLRFRPFSEDEVEGIRLYIAQQNIP